MPSIRLTLDLPAFCSHDVALEHASTELGERGIAGWERLELRTTSPTRSPLIRRFTFTYWTHQADTRVPENISYVKLWSRLGPTERAKLLTLTGGGRPTTTILRLLTTVAGSAILVTGPDGTPRLPRTFRVFLRTFADPKRDDHR
ncbi:MULTISPECIES: hypothetical protein [Rhodococcus]|uniref:hypothetical protein n=1 Tax=Rhodococcus TaxID=1827 RepID=UPI0002DD1517|nr:MULTISPECIES: hypothetical protein [Rhodococcus]